MAHTSRERQLRGMSALQGSSLQLAGVALWMLRCAELWNCLGVTIQRKHPATTTEAPTASMSTQKPTLLDAGCAI